MNKYKIRTPVPGHTEVIGMVSFVNGEAVCDADPDSAPLKYFHAQGYGIFQVGPDGEETPVGADVFDAPRPDKDEIIASLQAQLAEALANAKPTRAGAKDKETPA